MVSVGKAVYLSREECASSGNGRPSRAGVAVEAYVYHICGAGVGERCGAGVDADAEDIVDLAARAAVRLARLLV